MTALAPEFPRSLFAHKTLRLLLVGAGHVDDRLPAPGRGGGWQVYALTHSALALGLVGLVQFLPMLGLTLLVGHVADRYDRRRIIALCQLVEGLATGFLMLGSIGGWLTPGPIFAAVAVIGAARAFEMPSMQALMPGLVPVSVFPRAAAAAASAIQTATILAPAAGGFLYVLGPSVPYGLAGLMSLAACLCSSLIRMERSPRDARAGDLGLGLLGLRLHPRQPRHPGQHLPRSLRRAAGRGHGTAAGLRPGHPAYGALGPRPAALGPGHGRARHVGAAGPPAAPPAGRSHDVSRRHPLRPGDHPLRLLALALALGGGHGGDGGGRRHQRGDPQLPGPDRHARCRCAGASPP